MLLMLLFLWWAHSPLRIATGLPRIAITLVVIASMLITSGTITPTCFAEDRYDRDEGRSGTARARIAAANAAAEAENTHSVLREGTLIPPTVGRIVMLGRRWAFVPAGSEDEKGGEVATSQHELDVFRNSYATFESNRSGSHQSTHAASKMRPTRLGHSARTAAFDLSLDMQGKAEPMLPQVLLTENLMLQRIAEAIRADASDDRWTVSGEVTEFFNENRMLIRTAQRAGSK